MNKKIFAALAVILAVVGLVIGVVVSDAQASGWRYYDAFAAVNPAEKPEPSELKAPEQSGSFETLNSSRLQGLFDEVKVKMCGEFSTYSGLDWDRFERAELTIVDRFPYANAEGVTGYYDAFAEKLYVLIGFEKASDQFIKETLCHELFHALTVKPGQVHTLLYEGFVEYVAQGVYPLTDTSSYFMAQLFAKVYVQKNGLQKAIDVFCTDEIADEIGAAVERPNAIYVIEPLLEDSSLGNFENRIVNPIFEVLCKYSSAIEASPDSLSEELGYYGVAYPKDAAYLEGLLKKGR